MGFQKNYFMVLFEIFVSFDDKFKMSRNLFQRLLVGEAFQPCFQLTRQLSDR